MRGIFGNILAFLAGLVAGLLLACAGLGTWMAIWSPELPAPPKVAPAEAGVTVTVSEAFINQQLSDALPRLAPMRIKNITADLRPDNVIVTLVEGRFEVGPLRIEPKLEITCQIFVEEGRPQMKVIAIRAGPLSLPGGILAGPLKRFRVEMEEEFKKAFLERPKLELVGISTSEEEIRMDFR